MPTNWLNYEDRFLQVYNPKGIFTLSKKLNVNLERGKEMERFRYFAETDEWSFNSIIQ